MSDKHAAQRAPQLLPIVSDAPAGPPKLRAVGRLTLPVQPVVVTGIGPILPNCFDRETLWQHLRNGESQLAFEPDPADDFPSPLGKIHDFSCSQFLGGIPERLYASCHREQQFYLASIAEACRDAQLELSDIASAWVGLFDGTSRGSFAYWYEQMKTKLADPGGRFTFRDLHIGMPGQAVGLAAAIFGVRGPTYTFNGTCASGAIAIGNAYRELQAGRIDIAFATGHDAALVAPIFQMYRDASLLSEEKVNAAAAIRPFTGNSRNAFGEGSITLVLETRAHAEARGAPMLAEVMGFRHGNTGEHPTDVDFTGDRPAGLIEDALDEAFLGASDIDFVIGHGNGVQVSDLSELNYMRRVFGRRTREVPLISTKPIYGHTLGASSALNVAAAALMLDNDFVIPTINVDETRVVHGFNHQANRGAPKPLRAGVSMSYGIGGQNATLLLRKVSE